jgi:hypothetical protein
MADLTAAHRERVISVATSQLGAHETPANSNRTIYGAWYGLDANPWCAMFVSWAYFEAIGHSPFPASTSKGFAYCPSGASWFMRGGLWRDNSATPERGWVVFFNFPGDGVERISHVGIVTAPLADGRVATIEGNTNAAGSRTGGTVMIHNRSRAGGIAGYGALPFPSGSRAGFPPMPRLTATLRRGSPSNNPDHVQTLQDRLNALFSRWNSPLKMLDVDGEFGPRTEEAVEWFKTQTNGVLVSNGKPAFFDAINDAVGPKTMAMLWFFTIGHFAL